MKVHLKKGDLRRIQRKIDRFTDKLEDEVQEIVEETADIIYTEAKENAPVDTGELKESARKDIKEHIALVAFDAEHAHFPEFGSVKQAEQAYFRQAIAKGKAHYKKRMQNISARP